MGEFLTIPHTLHADLVGLPGNAFIVYSLLLKCVTFYPGNNRKPAHGSDFMEYPYSKAQKNGYKKSKAQFYKGIQGLIDMGYINKQIQGSFQGKNETKKQNLYRLLRF